MTKKRIILIAVIIAVAIVLIFGIRYLVTFLNYEKNVEAIELQNVDLSTIEDGEYFGDCDVDFVRAKVRVVVQNHQLVEIELLEHYNDRGSAAGELPERILEGQQTGVDTISGATASSKVIQEAIYNALTGKRTI